MCQIDVTYSAKTIARISIQVHRIKNLWTKVARKQSVEQTQQSWRKKIITKEWQELGEVTRVNWSLGANDDERSVEQIKKK